MFTAYVATKQGKITVCTMPSKRSKAKNGRGYEQETGCRARQRCAYGRIIAAFKNGVEIDIESSQHVV